jgi:hypothetical protein
MPLYKFLHNLLNVLVQIANKTGIHKTMCARGRVNFDNGTKLAPFLFSAFPDITGQTNREQGRVLLGGNGKLELQIGRVIDY